VIRQAVAHWEAEFLPRGVMEAAPLLARPDVSNCVFNVVKCRTHIPLGSAGWTHQGGRPPATESILGE